MRVEIDNPKGNETILASSDIFIKVNAECDIHITQEKTPPYYLIIRHIGKTFNDTIPFSTLTLEDGVIKIK